MSILLLHDRLTKDEQDYLDNVHSDLSLVFVRTASPVLDESGTTLDLHVGDSWFDRKRQTYYSIPESGVTLKSGEATVIRVAEELAVPYNVFGMVTGKGKLIFQGAFISPGKIDPGYKDKLLIGIYFGGDGTLKLRSGDAICGCSFVTIESHPKLLNQHRSVAPNQVAKPLTWTQRALDHLRRNWKIYMPWLLSLISIGSTIYFSYLRIKTGQAVH